MILIDLQLSGDKYAEHISKLLHICPQSKILAFSQPDSEHTYLQTLHPGAVGFISKHQSSKLLMNDIYAIQAEQTMFDRHITKQAQQARFNPNSSAEIQTEVRRSLQVKLNYVCKRLFKIFQIILHDRDIFPKKT